MVVIQASDLQNGTGIKTGLPTPLAGGVQLNTQSLPAAAGRTPEERPALSYPLARGCARLLAAEVTGAEILGPSEKGGEPGLHLLLANANSHAWVSLDLSSGSKTLCLTGMPFSSELVNYNFGAAVGVFLLLRRSDYPHFAHATREALKAWAGGESAAKAATMAVMADEMALAVEKMLDGSDPTGISAVVMDRQAPDKPRRPVGGGDELLKAFTSVEAFDSLVAGAAAETTEVVMVESVNGFVGDLPAKLEDCIRRGKHVLLTGPTATGKTLCVEEVCAKIGAPLVVIRGCEGLEDRDIIGSTVLVAEKNPEAAPVARTEFTLGPLPQAMLLAQRQHRARLAGHCETPPAVLLIDEVNRLQLRHQNFLVSALNVRRATSDYYLRIPDTNEEITCPEGSLVVVAARNAGAAFSGTNPMDLALERRFYKKIDLKYLSPRQEAALVTNRTGLESTAARALVKVAADTRYQLPQLKAPIDTDTLLKWAEEVAYTTAGTRKPDCQLLLDTARDVVFGIVLERTERGDFDPAAEAILTDNISENWKDEDA